MGRRKSESLRGSTLERARRLPLAARSARQHACVCAGRAQVGFASVRAQRVHGEAVLGATLFYAFAREMDCVDYNFPDLPGFERTALPEWEARVREPSTRM